MLLKKTNLLCVALLLGGCAAPGVSVERLNRISYPPSSAVEVLSQPPTWPYVVIARLQAKGTTGESSAQVIAALQSKAAALGATAIILHDESRQTVGRIQFNPSGGNYTTTPPQIIPEYRADAIINKKMQQNR